MDATLFCKTTDGQEESLDDSQIEVKYHEEGHTADDGLTSGKKREKYGPETQTTNWGSLAKGEHCSCAGSLHTNVHTTHAKMKH